jgi:hypothetical protein
MRRNLGWLGVCFLMVSVCSEKAAFSGGNRGRSISRSSTHQNRAASGPARSNQGQATSQSDQSSTHRSVSPSVVHPRARTPEKEKENIEKYTGVTE